MFINHFVKQGAYEHTLLKLVNQSLVFLAHCTTLPDYLYYSTNCMSIYIHHVYRNPTDALINTNRFT